MSNAGILKSSLIYLPSQFAILLISLTRGLILPKLLMPDDYGLVTIILLVIAYSKIANLGILNVFDREYPKMLGNDTYYADREGYKNSCFTLFMINNSVYSIIVFIYAWLKYSFNPVYVGLMALICLGMLLDNLNEFTVDIHRGHKNFKMVSLNRLLTNLAGVIFIIGLTYCYKLPGALIGVFFSNLVTILFYLHLKDKPKFKLNISLIKSLYTIGFGLFSVLMLSTVITTIDRVFVAKFYELSQVGIYNLSQSISRMVMLFFTSMTYILYPYLLSHFAKNEDLIILKKYFIDWGLIYSWTIPIILACLYIALHIFIPWFLPDYKAGLNFIHFLIIGVCWSALSLLLNTFLLTINCEGTIIKNQLLVIGAAAAYLGMATYRSVRIEHIAAIFAIYNFIYAALSYYSISKKLEFKTKEQIMLFCKFAFPFIFFTLLSYCILYFAGPGSQNTGIFINHFIIGILIVGVCSIPFLWYTNRETALMRESYQLIKSRFTRT